MLKSVERLPISAINLVLLSAFLLGALIAGALGSWTWSRIPWRSWPQWVGGRTVCTSLRLA